MSIYSVKDRVDENYVKEHLENYCEEVKIKNPKFTIDRCGKKGDNFVGLVYRVTIKGEKDGKDENVNAVLKLASRDEYRRKVIPTIRTFFIREVFFFRQIVPIFNEAGVSINNIPKLLYSNEEVMNEALLLEDLSIRGFVSMKQKSNTDSRENKIIDYEHASLTMRRLGEFHAKSFILREKHPEGFNALKTISEPLFSNIRKSKEYINFLFTVVDMTMEDVDPFYKLKLKVFNESFYEYLAYTVNGHNAEPYAVICHGDFWTANMMFRYQEDSLKPIDYNFIDFQICRYASPVLDIAYIMFCCTTPEFRKKYFDDLIKQYHNSLSEKLMSADLNPEQIFPYDKLLQQLQRFGNFGSVMALFVMHLFTTGDKDTTPEIGNFEHERELLLEIGKNNDVYRRLIRAVFIDSIDKHYI